MKKTIIDKKMYDKYKTLISEKKAFQKKVNTYFGTAVAILFGISLILMIVADIPWGFIGFIFVFLGFAITNAVIYSPIAKMTEACDDYEEIQEKEMKKIEENLRNEQEISTLDIMNKLDQIKKTAILETHTSKDNNDTLNRGVVGGLLFGATGAVVGTATAEEKSYTTFLIIFNDDTRTSHCVENGGTLYNHYIKFLEV